MRVVDASGAEIIVDAMQPARKLTTRDKRRMRQLLFVMAYREGFTVPDIANAFEVNESTVYRAITRATEALADGEDN